MAIHDLISSLKSDKKALTAVTVLGAAGLLLIMLSSLMPDKETEKKKSSEAVTEAVQKDYCAETEARLTEFLSGIDGVGRVEIFLTVSGNEEYIYATEGKKSSSENKTEEEYSYVMVGGGSNETALIETVISPEIIGAVIACTGCSDPSVQEEIYETVSTALGIPTSRIYVTKLK